MAGIPFSSYAGVAQQAMPMIQSFIPNDTAGGGALSGALSGASMGASLGPWGALAGGVIGGGLGLMQGQKRAAEKRKQEEQIKRMNYQNIVSNSQSILANYPSQGIVEAKFGGRIPFSMYMTPMSGGIAKPLAEGVTLYSGRKHEEGGIMLPNMAEIEDAEVIKEDKVYSDSLKPQGSKKTYAQLAEELGRKKGKFDIMLNSPDEAEATTAKLMSIKYDSKLESLFENQEFSKMNSNFNDKYKDGGRFNKKYKSNNPLVPMKTVIDPTGNRQEVENKPEYHYSQRTKTTWDGKGRPELLYSTTNSSLDRLFKGSQYAPAIDAFKADYKDFSEFQDNMHFTESPNNWLLQDAPGRKQAVDKFRNYPAARLVNFGRYDTQGLTGEMDTRYVEGLSSMEEALTINTPEYKGPALDVLTAGIENKGERMYKRKPMKIGYAGDGNGKSGMSVLQGGEYTNKYDVGGIMPDSMMVKDPITGKFLDINSGFGTNVNTLDINNVKGGFSLSETTQKGKPDILGGVMNALPLAGQFINDRFINKMETEVPYTQVQGPRYNYTSRMPAIRNMFMGAFRDANNAVKTGSQQYNAGLRSSMLGQTLTQLNQAADTETSRKDAIDQQFNSEVARTNYINTQTQNNALAQSMMNRNQKLGLKQQNIDNTIKGLIGNYAGNEARNLDFAKSWLAMSQAGNTGVDTRLMEQMPMWMRKYFRK